jgi:hypothetical protein
LGGAFKNVHAVLSNPGTTDLDELVAEIGKRAAG